MNNIYLYLNNPVDIPNSSPCQIDKITEVQDNSVDTFYLLDLLDYGVEETYASMLDVIQSKLKKDGAIVIQAPDIKQLIIAITFNKINFNYGRSVLYSDRLHMYTMSEIINMMKKYNYDCIIKKYI